MTLEHTLVKGVTRTKPKTIKQLTCYALLSKTVASLIIMVIVESWSAWYYKASALGWKLVGISVKEDNNWSNVFDSNIIDKIILGTDTHMIQKQLCGATCRGI